MTCSPATARSRHGSRCGTWRTARRRRLDGWVGLNAALGERVQIVGDDILVTNPAIIREAITRNIANAALSKLNQISTVTETLETMRLRRESGWAQMVSHRSGETEDSFVADLTVATGCGQLKSGSPGTR